MCPPVRPVAHHVTQNEVRLRVRTAGDDETRALAESLNPLKMASCRKHYSFAVDRDRSWVYVDAIERSSNIVQAVIHSNSSNTYARNPARRRIGTAFLYGARLRESRRKLQSGPEAFR